MKDAPVTLRTTQGHGVPSQYRPNHFKEWVEREDKRQERATSPISSFSPDHSLHRSSLFATIEGEPLANRHDALGRSLDELHSLRQTLHTPGHLVKTTTQLGHHCNQPLQGQKFLPHHAHHVFLGWNVPTPEARIGLPDSRVAHRKMGEMQAYNHAIHSKAHILTSRRA